MVDLSSVWSRVVGVCALVGFCSGLAEAGLVAVQETGPSANRVNIVFLGDGYTAAQVETLYPTHVQAMMHHFFQENEEPYVRYRGFFNAYRVDVISAESGADVPPQKIYRNTALDATYYADGQTERLLSINYQKADHHLDQALAGTGVRVDMRLVTVNDTRYGGAGGRWAVYAGGSASSTDIALHELGHSFHGLADEYGGYTTPYAGPEPKEQNVTKDSTGQKWSHWLGYDQPGVGVIGAYEGGKYYDRGLYRPSLNSKMRSLGRPFDAVAREKIIRDIYGVVDPLDAWLSNTELLVDPESLWVDVVDPGVIHVEWWINGSVLAGASGEMLDLSDYGYGPGEYLVTARAYDATDWVRIDRSLLEQSVSWSVRLVSVPEPGVLWMMVVVILGGRRMGRG